MEKSAKPVPENYHTAAPYLIAKDAAQAIDFYRRAFGAEEIMRIKAPLGKIEHAEIRIGNSVLMLSDEFPDMGSLSPISLGGTPVGILLYVPDVDAAFNKAVSAGGEVHSPVENKFYGDRQGSLKDPSGHIWHLATRKENMSQDEMQHRAAAVIKAH